MTKKEMEIKILELEKEILQLRLRIEENCIIFVPQIAPCLIPYPYPMPYYSPTYEPQPKITWSDTRITIDDLVQ